MALGDEAREAPDIYLTDYEMHGGKSNPAACMRIGSELLQPARCFSKTGVSSLNMFASAKKERPQSAQTLQGYAALFDKYYGGDSVITRMVQESKKQELEKSRPRPASASAADRDATLRSAPMRAAKNKEEALKAEQQRLEEEMEKRATRETRAKYLTPYLATKYKVEVEGMSGGTPLNPAVQGLTMVPTGSMPKDLALTPSDMQGAAKVMELASTLVEAEKARAARAAAARARRSAKMTSAPRAPAEGATRARPASSSFKTTSRDQAQRASVRTGVPSNAGGRMGPGKYDSGRYFMYMKPHVATPRFDAKQYGVELAEALVAEDSGESLDEPQGQGHACSRQPEQQQQQQEQASSRRRGGEATAAEQQPPAIMAVFKDAHRVHPQKPNPKGSSSFKAPPRSSAEPIGTADHLALRYFSEGYDAVLQKPPKLVTKFQHQVARPDPGRSDMPPALGPGVYLNRDYMPTNMTGQHVQAGHGAHARHTLSFALQQARPGSAPGPRPSWAGQGPSQAESQAALHAMFGANGADLDPLNLVSIAALEAAAEQGPGGAMLRHAHAAGPPRPASAYAPQPPMQPEGPISVSAVGLGPEHLAKFSSAGLAKRVPGGRMPLSTRHAETMGLRVMAKDGVVPPATGASHPPQGADVMYENQDAAQGHRLRVPAWKMPANRTAQSKAWVASAAMAYTDT